MMPNNMAFWKTDHPSELLLTAACPGGRSSSFLPEAHAAPPKMSEEVANKGIRISNESQPGRERLLHREWAEDVTCVHVPA